MTRSVFLASLMAFSIPSFAEADTKQEIAKCSEEQADAKRLVCFDSLAKSLGVDEVKVEEVIRAGKWHTETKVSPVDDSKTVILSLAAENKIKSQFGKDVTPVMILRCRQNKTNVFIAWGQFIGSSSTKVLTRIDKNKARTRNWDLSTDNKAVFAPKPIGFIKSLLGRSKLLSEVTPYGQSPVMATFDISGIDDAIKPLRKTCGW